jgi:formiminotetrahydrofolate cyclodeaminase
VASQQAYAGLEGAIMNVNINLPSIKDDGFKAQTAAEVSSLLAEGRGRRDEAYGYVSARLE